ncbi:hypothetical protein L1987_27089, partial [Smallanthus sonchifolius]
AAYEIDRIARIAFETACKRSGKLCSVDKANVLEPCSLSKIQNRRSTIRWRTWLFADFKSQAGRSRLISFYSCANQYFNNGIPIGTMVLPRLLL